MSRLLIRKAELPDTEAITMLVNRAYRPQAGSGGWTHEAALVSGDRIDRDRVSKGIRADTIWVASKESGMVGCVQVEATDRAAHIGMLAVDPSFQSSGAGKMLLAHAEDVAVQTFNAQIGVLMVIAARTELVDFYLRRGYSKTDEYSQYPRDAEAGTPTKEAMLLVKLQKTFHSPLRDSLDSAVSTLHIDFPR